MRIRLRTPTGQMVLELPEPTSSLSETELTYGHLIGAIERKCGIEVGSICSGVPPQPVELTDDIPLIASGIDWSKQLVTVEAKKRRVEEDTAGSNGDDRKKRSKGSESVGRSEGGNQVVKVVSKSAKIALSVKIETGLGEMVVRPMPDDNSCLFHAIAAATLNGSGLSVANDDRTSFDVESLRARVARRIELAFGSEGEESKLDDKSSSEQVDDGVETTESTANKPNRPDWLSEATLGKKPAAYASWIMQPESWGGEIEIKLLAEELGVEMCVVSVAPPHNLFSHRPASWDLEDGSSSPALSRSSENRSRCFLVYSGIHYDILAVRLPGGGLDDVVTMFPVDDDSFLAAASGIAAMLSERGYNTDTAKFKIRCEVCGWRGRGEREAEAHGIKTNHYSFGEVKSAE